MWPPRCLPIVDSEPLWAVLGHAPQAGNMGVVPGLADEEFRDARENMEGVLSVGLIESMAFV